MPPPRPAYFGTRSSVTSSVGSSTVVNGPVMNSAIGITRSPDVLRATTSAPHASITEPQSPSGSACAIDPHTVPRFLTIGSEIHGAAAAIVWLTRPTTSDATTSLWRTSAPTRSCPSESSM